MRKGYKSICQIRAGSLVRQSVGLLRYACCDLLTRDTQRSRVQLPPGPRIAGLWPSQEWRRAPAVKVLDMMSNGSTDDSGTLESGDVPLEH